MYGENEVEFVMKCKVRTRTHTTRGPCATSTPIKEPSNSTKNNCVRNENHLHSYNGGCKTAPSKVNNLLFSGKRKSIFLKNKTSLIGLYSSSDDDEDDDEKNKDEVECNGNIGKKNNEPKKHLIIKLGSSQNNCRRVKKQNSVDLIVDGVPEVNSKKRVCAKDYDKKDASKSKENCQNSVPEQCSANVEVNQYGIYEENKSSRCNNKVNVNENKMQVGSILTENKINDEKFNMSIHSNEMKLSGTKKKNETERLIKEERKKCNTLKDVTNKLSSSAINFENCKESFVEKEKRKGKASEKNENYKPDADRIVQLYHQTIDNKQVSKLSVSHEIFSDSKEKQHLDSLDLTADDAIEIEVDGLNSNSSFLKHSLKKNCVQKIKTLKKRNNLNTNTVESSKVKADSKEQIVRSCRKRKSPKEFWLPQSSNEKINFLQSVRVAHGMELKNEGNLNATKLESDCEGEPEAKISKSGDIDENSKNASHNSDLVKDISKIEFIKDCSNGGKETFSTALGWQFSTFKCCIMKIGKNCEASGRTDSVECHLGGIICNGTLSMSIQGKEIKLRKGHLFHVPPLSDWKAVNKGRVECVIYYWLGKFS